MMGLTAKDIMTTDVKTVRQHTTLRDVAELLAEHNIGGVPVVDDEGLLVGMVTAADLIDEDKRGRAIPRTALFGLWTVSDESMKSAFDEGFSLTARDVMTHPAIAAREDTPVEELADTMLDRHINRIPIVRDGKPVGIISRTDVLRGLRRR